MKQEVELVKRLRCKLRMFGVPLNEPASMHCDNEAVHKSLSISESVLNKKMYCMSYHFCREAVATNLVRVAKENALTNLADLFMNLLGKVKRDGILKKIMC